MPRKDYTFETDVLTLIKGPWFSNCKWVADDKTPNTFNMACCSEVLAAGWVLPDRIGSKITLVFTTTPTRGASTCVTSDLLLAGEMAMIKHAPALTRRSRRETKLYWWPMIVTGGK